MEINLLSSDTPYECLVGFYWWDCRMEYSKTQLRLGVISFPGRQKMKRTSESKSWLNWVSHLGGVVYVCPQAVFAWCFIGSAVDFKVPITQRFLERGKSQVFIIIDTKIIPNKLIIFLLYHVHSPRLSQSSVTVPDNSRPVFFFFFFFFFFFLSKKCNIELLLFKTGLFQFKFIKAKWIFIYYTLIVGS